MNSGNKEIPENEKANNKDEDEDKGIFRFFDPNYWFPAKSQKNALQEYIKNKEALDAYFENKKNEKDATAGTNKNNYGKIFILIIIVLLSVSLKYFLQFLAVNKTIDSSTSEIYNKVFIVIVSLAVMYFLYVVLSATNKGIIYSILNAISSFILWLTLHKGETLKLVLLILYTIGIVYFYSNNPDKISTNYSTIITIMFLLFTSYLFYTILGMKMEFIDLKFEIFKEVIVFISFLIIFIMFFQLNQGGYLMEYFSVPIYIVIFAVGILIALYLFLYVYSEYNLKTNASNPFILPDTDNFKGLLKSKGILYTIMKYFIVLTLFFGFLAVSIQFVMNGISAASSASSIFRLIVNVLIIIVIAALVYKLISYTSVYQESPLIQLIVNVIFYIPCLLVSFIDNFLKITGLDELAVKIKNKKSGLFNPSRTDYVLLVIAIILNIIYFVYPYVATNNATRGGKLLLDKPIYTNKVTVLDTYQNLNGSSEIEYFSYTYAISFWVYIDAATPDMSIAYNKYTTLLNYGNKPNVMYRGKDNTLMITMEDFGPNTPANNKIKEFQKNYELDDLGNRIIYVKSDVLLQKWNNIIINYNGGTLDIFYNGELVRSAIEVIPYMKKDVLSVGTEKGIHGGICSVYYFNKTLNIQQIYNLYNFGPNNDKTNNPWKILQE